MTVYRGNFGGITPIGIWDTTMYLSSDTATIGFVFGQFLNFVAALWQGDGVMSFGLQSRTSTNVALTRYQLWELDPLSGKAISTISASDSAHGVGPNALGPIQACGVCELRASWEVGPSLGRMHTPPLMGSEYLEGRIKPTSVAAIRDNFQYAFDNNIGTGVIPVLYSRKSRATASISSFFIPDLPGILTRRCDKYISSAQSGTVTV